MNTITTTEAWCNHDAPAVRFGVCECGAVLRIPGILTATVGDYAFAYDLPNAARALRADGVREQGVLATVERILAAHDWTAARDDWPRPSRTLLLRHGIDPAWVTASDDGTSWTFAHGDVRITLGENIGGLQGRRPARAGWVADFTDRSYWTTTEQVGPDRLDALLEGIAEWLDKPAEVLTQSDLELAGLNPERCWTDHYGVWKIMDPYGEVAVRLKGAGQIITATFRFDGMAAQRTAPVLDRDAVADLLTAVRVWARH